MLLVISFIQLQTKLDQPSEAFAATLISGLAGGLGLSLGGFGSPPNQPWCSWFGGRPRPPPEPQLTDLASHQLKILEPGQNQDQLVWR